MPNGNETQSHFLPTSSNINIYTIWSCWSCCTVALYDGYIDNPLVQNSNDLWRVILNSVYVEINEVPAALDEIKLPHLYAAFNQLFNINFACCSWSYLCRGTWQWQLHQEILRFSLKRSAPSIFWNSLSGEEDIRINYTMLLPRRTLWPV